MQAPVTYWFGLHVFSHCKQSNYFEQTRLRHAPKAGALTIKHWTLSCDPLPSQEPDLYLPGPQWDVHCIDVMRYSCINPPMLQSRGNVVL